MTKSVQVTNNAGNIIIGDAPEYQVDSAINELLKSLASTPFQFDGRRRKPPASTIVKIEHNRLQAKKYIIKQYTDHSAAVEAAYAGIDSLISFGKQTILTNLNDLYYSALDSQGIEYLDCEIDLSAVRERADFILDFVIQKLKNTAFESKNKPLYKEEIERGINVVVAHAFVECVIFETPEDDS